MFHLQAILWQSIIALKISLNWQRFPVVEALEADGAHGDGSDWLGHLLVVEQVEGKLARQHTLLPLGNAVRNFGFLRQYELINRY